MALGKLPLGAAWQAGNGRMVPRAAGRAASPVRPLRLVYELSQRRHSDILEKVQTPSAPETRNQRHGPTSPYARSSLRSIGGCWTQSHRQSHDRRRHRGSLQPARPAQGDARRRRHRGDRQPAGDRGRRPRAGAEQRSLPVQGSCRRRRRDASRGRRARCRHSDPLGRSGAAGRAGVRSAEAECGRAEAAVRLQQRFSRLSADAGRGQPVAARPARRQSRIHQRRADVSRHRYRPADQGARTSPRSPRNWPRSRWPRTAVPCWRSARERRQMAGGAGFEICPPHRCRHADGDHRPGRRSRRG